MERNPGAEDDSHGEDGTTRPERGRGEREREPEAEAEAERGDDREHEGSGAGPDADGPGSGSGADADGSGSRSGSGSGQNGPEDERALLPLDEEAAWEQIVASYGDHPKAEDMAPAAEPGGDTRTGTTARPSPGTRPDGESEGDEPGSSLRSFTVYSAGAGPRDWRLPSQSDDADGTGEEDDEGHFVPPEPPPLPRADTTAKFAWLAVLGGPLLLILTVLFQQELTWWIGTLGVGGFLGGFATLVARMRDERDEDDWDDPGRGAVV